MCWKKFNLIKLSTGVKQQIYKNVFPNIASICANNSNPQSRSTDFAAFQTHLNIIRYAGNCITHNLSGTQRDGNNLTVVKVTVDLFILSKLVGINMHLERRDTCVSMNLVCFGWWKIGGLAQSGTVHKSYFVHNAFWTSTFYFVFSFMVSFISFLSWTSILFYW